MIDFNELPPRTQEVLKILYWFRNKTGNQTVVTKVKTLMRLSGYAERSIQRSIKDLKELGIIRPQQIKWNYQIEILQNIKIRRAHTQVKARQQVAPIDRGVLYIKPITKKTNTASTNSLDVERLGTCDKAFLLAYAILQKYFSRKQALQLLRRYGKNKILWTESEISRKRFSPRNTQGLIIWLLNQKVPREKIYAEANRLLHEIVKAELKAEDSKIKKLRPPQKPKLSLTDWLNAQKDKADLVEQAKSYVRSQVLSNRQVKPQQIERIFTSFLAKIRHSRECYDIQGIAGSCA